MHTSMISIQLMKNLKLICLFNFGMIYKVCYFYRLVYRIRMLSKLLNF
jgi:hypothetical protein